MSQLERAGPVAVAVAAVGIGGAILASPTFSVAGNALSDLGQPGGAAATGLTRLLFNDGLVLSGLVGLPFAGVLVRGGNVLERLGVLPFVIALLGMMGVGLFPAGEPLHVPAALTLYLGSMAAMGLCGLGAALSGATRRGGLTLTLVLVHAGVWWAWAAGGAVTRGGLAIPEIVGAAIFGAWVVWTASRHRDTGPATD